MRVCAWCRGEIPAAARRDALCCSKRCRQARHRFRSGVGVAPDVDLFAGSGGVMRAWAAFAGLEEMKEGA